MQCNAKERTANAGQCKDVLFCGNARSRAESSAVTRMSSRLVFGNCLGLSKLVPVHGLVHPQALGRARVRQQRRHLCLMILAGLNSHTLLQVSLVLVGCVLERLAVELRCNLLDCVDLKRLRAISLTLHQGLAALALAHAESNPHRFRCASLLQCDLFQAGCAAGFDGHLQAVYSGWNLASASLSALKTTQA